MIYIGMPLEASSLDFDYEGVSCSFENKTLYTQLAVITIIMSLLYGALNDNKKNFPKKFRQSKICVPSYLLVICS